MRSPDVILSPARGVPMQQVYYCSIEAQRSTLLEMPSCQHSSLDMQPVIA